MTHWANIVGNGKKRVKLKGYDLDYLFERLSMKVYDPDRDPSNCKNTIYSISYTEIYDSSILRLYDR